MKRPCGTAATRPVLAATGVSFLQVFPRLARGRCGITACGSYKQAAGVRGYRLPDRAMLLLLGRVALRHRVPRQEFSMRTAGVLDPQSQNYGLLTGLSENSNSAVIERITGNCDVTRIGKGVADVCHDPEEVLQQVARGTARKGSLKTYSSEASISREPLTSFLSSGAARAWRPGLWPPGPPTRVGPHPRAS